MAAVLMFGFRAVPGVFIGAAIINGQAFYDGSTLNNQLLAISAAAAIGVGSFLQPLAGRFLLSKFGNSDDPFSDGITIVRTGFLFALACLVSSSIGSQVLSVSGYSEGNSLDVFLTWWIGDYVGVVAFTALVLAIFRQSKLNAATLLLATVITFGGTFFLSEHVRSDAKETWDGNATREAERLTTTLISWIETASSPVNSIGALFESSNDVFEDEFIEATIRLEDFQPDFFPTTMAIANVATSAQGTNDWEILYSTNESGPLSVGSIVIEGALISDSIQAALDEPGRLVIGEFAEREGTQFAFASVAIERQDYEQVVIGKIDLGQMFDGLFAVQVPQGFHVEVQVASSGKSPEDLQTVYAHGHVHENVIDTKLIRGVAGNAKFSFNWDVTDAFLPGSRTQLPNAVLVGGIMGSAILILFLTFILGQNEKIRQRVKERTAELDQERAALQATMEAMDQGLSMFNGDLELTARNSKFMDMFDLPREIFPIGAHMGDMFRISAERGEYGDGDPNQMVQERLDLAAKFEAHRFERQRPDGRYIEVRGNPLSDGGGFVTTYTDITERKLAEEEIERQRAQLDDILSNISQGIVKWDKDKKLAQWNDVWPDMLQVQEDMLKPGVHLYDFTLNLAQRGFYGEGEPSKITEERVAALWEGETRADVSFGDDRKFFAQSTKTPDGGLIITFTDITERKKAEEEIAQKQAALRMTLDNMPGGICMLDADLKIQVVNKQYCDLYGHEPEVYAVGRPIREVIQMNVEAGFHSTGDHVGSDIESTVRRRIRAFRSGVAGRSERELPNGRILSIRHNPIDGGGIVLVVTDITERRLAEKEIQRQEARIRGIMESVPDSVITMGVDGVIQSVNDATVEIFGHAKQDMIGEPINMLMPKDMASMHDNFITNYLETGVAQFIDKGPRELQSVRSNGEVFPIDLALAEAKVDDDLVFIGVLRDITERKHAQQILADKEAQLRLALENMPGAMIVVNDDLEVVLINDSYKDFYGDSGGLAEVGASMADLLKSEVDRGILDGEGTPEEILKSRIDGYKNGVALNTIDHTDDGRDIQLIRKPIDGGYTISVAVDITELKRTERELANKEALLSAALENMTGGLFMIDPSLKLRVFNDRMAELYDLPPGTLGVGFPLEQVLRVRAERGDYGPGDPDDLIQARLEGYRNRDVQIVTDHVGGKIIEVYRAPMEDGSMVCVFNDVTERKRAEEELNKAHSLITESLTYASRIQRSLLPPKTIMEEVFKDHFVLWEPTATVGGDMVWLRPSAGGVYLIVADCTGHGPPGAFMTMICTGALDQALAEIDAPDSAAILQSMNQKIKIALGQDSKDGESDDGVELGVCHIDQKHNLITFAGARFSLVKIEKSEMTEIKGNKSSIGYRHVPMDASFDNHVFEYDPDMRFYMWTDGMVDQIGGPKRRSFGKRRLRKIILEYSQMRMSWQRSQILREFEDYQHTEQRRDDITMVGFIPRNG